MLTLANSRHFLITSPQRRGGLSAQLLTGICDPADSVMSGSTTSLLVRQRKRRIQDNGVLSREHAIHMDQEDSVSSRAVSCQRRIHMNQEDNQLDRGPVNRNSQRGGGD